MKMFCSRHHQQADGQVDTCGSTDRCAQAVLSRSQCSRDRRQASADPSQRVHHSDGNSAAINGYNIMERRKDIRVVDSLEKSEAEHSEKQKWNGCGPACYMNEGRTTEKTQALGKD